MRKAIVSLGAGPQARLLRLAATTLRPYARRHGYHLHLHTDVLDPSRPAPWSKIVALQRLQESYEVLVWADADLMVVDGRRDIADDLRPGTFLGLVEHRRRDGTTMANSGVMVLRTGDDCSRFLDAIWRQDDVIHHRWWENAAVCRLLGYDLEPLRIARSTPWRDRTTFLDPRWNSIHDAPAERPWIRHYPGYKPVTRAAFMLRDLAVSRLP